MPTVTMAAPTVTTMGTASYAAPMTTTTVAAPASYAAPIMAAPASYAAPMTVAAPASYAAPVATVAAPASYAAPITTVAAAPVLTTTAAPSYVAAPQAVAMPQTAIVPPPAPIAPAKLTEGIPTPEQIAQQKNGYAAALDKQLKEAIETVQKETAIEKEMIKFNAEKTLALYNMQVDEKLIEANALEDERGTIRLLELKKALVERNLQLSNQASQLTMDYELKALQTEWAQKRYTFDQQYAKAENKLAAEFNKQVAAANTGTSYTVPAQAVTA